MGMPQSTLDWTAAMLADLPDDGQRYEVVDGELLVTPAPAIQHQRAVGRLYYHLVSYLHAHPVGEALLSPADVELDPRTLVQPDIFVVPLVEGRGPRDWQEAARLLLAIEVTSPSTARYDRLLKRRRYQRAGVPEYWIVDLDARLVERWRPDDARPEILVERVTWQPAEREPGLEIELVAMFAEIHGE